MLTSGKCKCAFFDFNLPAIYHTNVKNENKNITAAVAFAYTLYETEDDRKDNPLKVPFA